MSKLLKKDIQRWAVNDLIDIITAHDREDTFKKTLKQKSKRFRERGPTPTEQKWFAEELSRWVDKLELRAAHLMEKK